MTSSSQSLWIQRLVSYVIAAYLHLVGKTSIVQRLDHPSYLTLHRTRKPFIYAFWHNAQVFLAYDHRGEKANIMVSRSKDGEYIAQVMKRMDLNAVRGSSSIGGAKAFRELVYLLKEKGAIVGFTPDGPRGPVYSVSSGVIVAAQLSGAPIVPIMTSLSRKLVFNSWDRFQVPLPFGRIVIGHGKPFTISPDEKMDQAKEKVKKSLVTAQDEADLALSASPSWVFSAMGAAATVLYACLGFLLLPLGIPAAMMKYGFKRTLTHLGRRLSWNHISSSGDKPRLWFHAASLGEWQALRPLLKKFQALDSVSIFVTVSTPEAEHLVHQQEPTVVVRLLPLDLPILIDQFVKRLNPHALVLIETELWPLLIQSCYQRKIPVFIANGRLSSKSLVAWKLLKPFASRFLSQISWFFVRTEKDGKNFCNLKASSLRMTVTGNVKNDSLKILSWEEKLRRRKDLFKNQEGLWVVAGSTWPQEEAAILPLLSQNFSKKVRLILAPRRPERFKEVEKLLETFPQTWSKWSMVKNVGEWSTEVLLVDTLGDLKDLYAVSDIAFIGGTLSPHGGQNPLEPAAARVPILFGPSMENFHEEAIEFKKKGAARQVRHQADLLSDLRDLIEDDSLRRSMGEAAASVVFSKQGAGDKTVQGLRDLLSI